MMEVTVPEKITLTPEEAAALTHIGEDNIRRLCRTNASFPAFMNGRNILIPRKGLEEWLNDQGSLKLGFPEWVRNKGRKRA